MTEIELLELIKELKEGNEQPYIEIKSNLADLVQIGKTISALVNSASYSNLEYAYLIWGLEDTTWKVIGTNFDLKNEKWGNQDGQLWMNAKFNSIPHYEKHEFYIEQKRLYLLKIKSCQNNPICFENVPYIRIGSHIQELIKYPEIHKYILNKNNNPDWSAQVCQGATIEDLDLEALELARNGYLQKQQKLNHQSQIDIIKNIDLSKDSKKFLRYAKMLTPDGDLNNACMLLVGRDKSLIKCGFAGEISYLELTFGVKEIFGVPFQRAITSIVNKISIREIELPVKFLGEYTGNHKLLYNYKVELLREIVANSVAHQDYSKQCRISLRETVHKSIEIINEGCCIYSQKEFEAFQLGSKIPNKYRNQALADAMVEIGIMEAKGTGYNKLFVYNTQSVYLPLPTVNWKNQTQFEVTLYGASIDSQFTEILSTKTDLEPEHIMLLDNVQKGFRIDQKMFYQLKSRGLVDGTPTKGRLSLEIAQFLDKTNEEDLKTQGYNFRNIFESSLLPHLKTRKDGMNKQEIIDFAINHIKYTDKIDRDKVTSDITNSLQKLKREKKIKLEKGQNRSFKWIKI